MGEMNNQTKMCKFAFVDKWPLPNMREKLDIVWTDVELCFTSWNTKGTIELTKADSKNIFQMITPGTASLCNFFCTKKLKNKYLCPLREVYKEFLVLTIQVGNNHENGLSTINRVPATNLGADPGSSAMSRTNAWFHQIFWKTADPSMLF